jgi:hypothetical protein
MVYLYTKKANFNSDLKALGWKMLVRAIWYILGRLEYCMVIWYIVWSFGIFVEFWYIFPASICCTKKNLATLLVTLTPTR